MNTKGSNSFILVHASVLFDACRSHSQTQHVLYFGLYTWSSTKCSFCILSLPCPPGQNPFLGIVSSWLRVLIMLLMMLTYSCDFGLAGPPIPLSGD